jgi:hypothetical protein
MKSNVSASRRACLSKLAGAIAVIPLAALSMDAVAAKNDSLRQALKYQDTPKDGKQCTACIHWVPGKTATDKGGCKIIPSDTEISPAGWCSAFVETKK